VVQAGPSGGGERPGAGARAMRRPRSAPRHARSGPGRLLVTGPPPARPGRGQQQFCRRARRAHVKQPRDQFQLRFQAENAQRLDRMGGVRACGAHRGGGQIAELGRSPAGRLVGSEASISSRSGSSNRVLIGIKPASARACPQACLAEAQPRRCAGDRACQPFLARVLSLVWEPLKTSWSPGSLPEGAYCQKV
jgi:hypothetical protein